MLKRQAPKIQAPKIQAQKIQAQKIQVPKIQVPKIQAPNIEAQNIEARTSQNPTTPAPQPRPPELREPTTRAPAGSHRVLLARRTALLAAPALALAAARPISALAATPTPSQSEGPFYPRRPPADRDADLTRFGGLEAPGETIEMVGTVTDAGARPVAGAVIEIWHCDPRGVYAHVGFQTAPGFQGFGAARCAADGSYRFRTTRPGVYPGRARHIHVKVRGPGARPLTTQMYFPGEPDNARDGLLRRAANPALLIAREQPGPPRRYVFDIVLA